MLLALAAAALISLHAAPARANEVINGSFESPLVPNNGLTLFAANSTLIQGWTVFGHDVAVLDTGFTCCGSFVTIAQDGNQFVDLTGNSERAGGGVSQAVQTIPGREYVLGFSVGDARVLTTTPGGSFVNVGLGGSSIGTFGSLAAGGTVQWQHHEVHFIATGSAAILSFSGADAVGDVFTGLDNVTLDLVPVPVPGMLVLFGACAAGLARRRLAPSGNDSPC
ncbi:MAG: DUF642 domain-containing protein [Gammaproteobacteria bacterium]